MGKIARFVQVEKTSYTLVSNDILRDKDISFKAKGLLAFILSLPDDWNFTTLGLSKIVKDGRNSIISALKELKKAGYYDSKITFTKNGKCVVNIFSETPHSDLLGLYEKACQEGVSFTVDNQQAKLLKTRKKQDKTASVKTPTLNAKKPNVKPKKVEVETEEKASTTTQNKPKIETLAPPTQEDFVELAKQIYYEELNLDFRLYKYSVIAKYNNWNESNWIDGFGRPITNWRVKLRNTVPYLKPFTPNNSNNNNNNYYNDSNNNSNGASQSKNAMQFLINEFKATTGNANPFGNF